MTVFFAPQVVAGLALSTLLFTVSCTAPPPAADSTPFRAVVGEKALMTSVIDPATDVVWGAVGTIMTLEGTQELVPSTDEEWDAVRNASVVVAESGNLLMIGRRARDQGEWIKWSSRLTDVGIEAMQAAEARDPEALFQAGADLYDVCLGCHKEYLLGNP